MKSILFYAFIVLSSVTMAQNVGIGTAAPAVKLHVSSPSDTALLLIDNNTALNTNTSTGMYFKNGTWYTAGIKTIGTGINTARLGLYTFASNGGTNNLKERLSINDDGNVGINNINPNAKLDVLGTFEAANNSLSAFTGTISNYSPGKGALKLNTGNATGLFVGSATLVAENDTITGSAIRAIAKWNAISAESISGSVSTMSVRNSSTTGSALAARFTGNVIIDSSTTNSNSGSLIVNKNFQYLQGSNAGDGKILISDASGNASWDGPVAFYAKKNATAFIGSNFSGDVAFGGEEYDTRDMYNSSFNYFTAPVTGYYHFDVALEVVLATAPATDEKVQLNIAKAGGGTFIYALENHFISSGHEQIFSLQKSCDILLTAGTLIKVTLDNNTSSVLNMGTSRASYFSAHLIR